MSDPILTVSGRDLTTILGNAIRLFQAQSILSTILSIILSTFFSTSYPSFYFSTAKLNRLVNRITAMVLITREQVICMFYHQPYSKRKAEELLKAIENIHTEICYKGDLTKPFFLYKNSVFMDPVNNHTYINEIETTDVIQNNKKEIVSLAQLVSFLNIIILPSNPRNEEVYACRSLSMNDILSIVWKHTNILDDMNAQGLSK